MACEFPVGQQHTDGRGGEMCKITFDQGNAHGGVGATAALDHRPEQRHPEPAGDDGQHEEIHLSLADLPVCAVECEQPRSVLPQDADQQRQRPILTQTDMLKEALQPTIGGCRLHCARPLASNMAEVHAARAHHADHDQTQCLQTALAQIDLWAQNLGEGGNGSVRHGTFP